MIDSVKKAIEIGKQLRDVARKIKDAELRGLVGDLMMELADAKEQIAALQEAKLDAESKLRDSLSMASLRAQMEMREDGLYYFSEGPEDRPQGPYCPHCLNESGTLNLVTIVRGPQRNFGGQKCRPCKTFYN